MFALVVSTTETGTTLATDRVDFIDENNAGCIFLCLLEHVAHTCRTDTNEHLDKIRTGNREEWHLCFTRNGARQQGLAGTGRTHHQDAAGDASAELLEFGRVAQELDELGDFFFRFIAARHIGKRDQIIAFVEHFCAALAK